MFCHFISDPKITEIRMPGAGGTDEWNSWGVPSLQQYTTMDEGRKG
jgi:hypothetical protein